MAARSFASTSAFLFRPRPSTLALSCRHHSSGPPPIFAPSGSTSAHTEIPYGDSTCASSAYLPPLPSAPPAEQLAPEATQSTPLDLTPEQRRLLEEIIRVDQAGELGANLIYQGQHAVFARGKDKSLADIVQVCPSLSLSLPSPIADFLNAVKAHVGWRKEAYRRI